jgi:hypothetical protein
MPPVVIAGGIAAAGAVGSAAIASKGASKAAKAQTESADKSTAVQQQIYGENKQTLSPYVNAGLPATQAINSFLGLTPSNSPAQQTQAQPNALAQFAGPTYGYEGMDGPLGGRGFEAGTFDSFGSPATAFSVNGLGGFGGGFGGGVPQPQQQAINGRDAFRTFLDNSDYAFQFGEGANRVNSGYAGAGMLQSGAAMKGLERFRQDLQSGYRGEFLNALGNQQSVGLQAAGAQAGVGTNYANSLGTINQARADGIGNAALLKAQNTGNAINGATSSIAYMLGRR